jgi:hypothetical protein
MSLIDLSDPFVEPNHGQKENEIQKNHLDKVGFVGEKRGLNFQNTIKTKVGRNSFESLPASSPEDRNLQIMSSCSYCDFFPSCPSS